MYQPTHRPARAHVVGESSLLRAGLERAARQVGIVVVDDGEDATITLRHSLTQSWRTALAVTVEPGQVTMNFSREPSDDEWDTLRTLVGEVLDSFPGVGNST